MQELVERDNISCLIGPLATAEALAIDDYIRDKQIPTLSVAAAEDMTQRKANPWFVRATSTSAQCSYPIADYAAKHLKYKRIAAIADDFAYGHELVGGFHKVFEDNGGTLVQKLFSPLNAPDYGSYIAQLKTDMDAVFLGFAGGNGFRFFKQYNEYGMKTPILGGMTAFDEVAVRNMGDYALGAISSCWYTAQLDNSINKRFVETYRKENGYDPGQYASGTYLYGEVLAAAINALKGKIEDKNAFIKALRAVRVDTLRGPIKFDEYGNVVGNIYIRKVEKKDGRLVNTNIQTYPDVSQFWTYDPKEFLKHPVWSRDFPPMKS
jgi:branched-chain amino acid transport system substrate-binding protein